jgi:hypothetical protein
MFGGANTYIGGSVAPQKCLFCQVHNFLHNLPLNNSLVPNFSLLQVFADTDTCAYDSDAVPNPLHIAIHTMLSEAP